MPKHSPSQRWQPPGQTTPPTEPKNPETSRLALWAERLGFIRRIVLDASFLALIIGFGWVVYQELRRDEVILYPIEIPKKLEESGYTGAVVAEKLLDEARRISIEAQDMAKNNSWREEAGLGQTLDADSHLPDIQVPGADFTLRTLLRYLRQELGLMATYIKGEIILTPNGYQLTLRNISEESVPAAQTPPENNLQKLLGVPGGETLLKTSKPSVLAIWNYHKLQKAITLKQPRDGFIKAFQDSIDHCLRYPPVDDDTLAYYLKGTNFYDLKKYPEAIDQFQKALSLDSSYDPAYIGWGLSLTKQKKYKEAIEKYEIAVKLNPYSANIYNNWGNAFYEWAEYNKAIAKYQKAVRLDPNFAIAYNNWGNALYQLEDYNKAIDNFQKAVQLDPDFAIAYNNLGNVYSARNEYKEAFSFYSKATHLNRGLAIAYNNWSDALLKSENYSEAIDKIKKAVQSDPNSAIVYETWGEILMKQGKSNEAQKKFKKAKELYSNL